MAFPYGSTVAAATARCMALLEAVGLATWRLTIAIAPNDTALATMNSRWFVGHSNGPIVRYGTSHNAESLGDRSAIGTKRIA